MIVLAKINNNPETVGVDLDGSVWEKGGKMRVFSPDRTERVAIESISIVKPKIVFAEEDRKLWEEDVESSIQVGDIVTTWGKDFYVGKWEKKNLPGTLIYKVKRADKDTPAIPLKSEECFNEHPYLNCFCYCREHKHIGTNNLLATVQ